MDFSFYINPFFSRINTELFDGDGFEQGPVLPYEAYDHCAIEVEPGVVFMAGGSSSSTEAVAYTIDVGTGEVEELPGMPQARNKHACGIVPNPDGQGMDIVVAGGQDNSYLESVVIYNTESGTWRPGPFLPNTVAHAGYHPYGDTFVIIGGTDGDRLDTVYMYDFMAEDWELVATLEYGRDIFASAIVSPSALLC